MPFCLKAWILSLQQILLFSLKQTLTWFISEKVSAKHPSVSNRILSVSYSFTFTRCFMKKEVSSVCISITQLLSLKSISVCSRGALCTFSPSLLYKKYAKGSGLNKISNFTHLSSKTRLFFFFLNLWVCNSEEYNDCWYDLVPLSRFMLRHHSSTDHVFVSHGTTEGSWKPPSS